ATASTLWSRLITRCSSRHGSTLRRSLFNQPASLQVGLTHASPGAYGMESMSQFCQSQTYANSQLRTSSTPPAFSCGTVLLALRSNNVQTRPGSQGLST